MSQLGYMVNRRTTRQSTSTGPNTMIEAGRDLTINDGIFKKKYKPMMIGNKDVKLR